ncbi:MAG: hypothetical protein K0A99_09170, partial [Desulfoarculaceae bacterium]|nr:hypothetical protein [Desulfoarculaceae bacterium]
ITFSTRSFLLLPLNRQLIRNFCVSPADRGKILNPSRPVNKKNDRDKAHILFIGTIIFIPDENCLLFPCRNRNIANDYFPTNNQGVTMLPPYLLNT